MTLSENEKINAFYYNKTASSYEMTGRIHQAGNKARIRRLLSMLIPRRDIRVLDVCSGTGLYLSVLKDLVEPGNLFGTDISSEMLRVSSAYCNRLHLGSVYALPFSENTFDLVTCSSALHHLESPPQALGEIFRVLKPNGIFLSDYDNNVHFAKLSTLKRRFLKLILVYPILLKAIQKISSSGSNGRQDHFPARQSLEEIPLEEVHKMAEPQNYHFDGINGYHLQDLLKQRGFRRVEIFTYHSGRWNDGERFGLLASFTNNKLYSISQK